MNPLYATALFQAASPPDGWPQVFAIITACNPCGHTADDRLNRKLDARLLAKLKEQGCWFSRVIGGSPDFFHAEPGFAVVLTLFTALKVGDDFAQEAIFWVEDDELSVIACRGNAQQKLGSWRERLARGNAVPRRASCFGTAADGIAPIL